jgi:hypothetical protein
MKTRGLAVASATPLLVSGEHFAIFFCLLQKPVARWLCKLRDIEVYFILNPGRLVARKMSPIKHKFRRKAKILQIGN